MHYTVAMPQPHSHLYHVTVEVTTDSAPVLAFRLPTWTPGSYMIREFARHVQAFRAEADGQPLPWQKTSKDTWQVETGGAAQIQLHYQVYANELTVRTSHLDGSHGYFNLANLAMYLPEQAAAPVELTVVAPAAWHVATGLDPLAAPEGAPADTTAAWRFAAADYDELVDCPVHCGEHERLAFAVADVPHEIVIWGAGNYEPERLVADTRQIVETVRAVFGELPYRRYLFILLLTDKGAGGLEHRNSVTNMLPRWTFRPERSYERYRSLTCHEFIHVWNVKQLRPAPLGPFDYQQENYSRQLWVVEGFTSYYDDLLLVRAGLSSPERYLEQLAEAIEQLQNQPGRLLQSLAESSMDAWIKFYRPDEHSANSSISYYLKGSLIALLIDMEIRRGTAGDLTLDDLLRALLAAYPADGPGIPEERGVEAMIEELTDRDWRGFFERYVTGTAEIDYNAFLAVVGLELVWSVPAARGEANPAWLGLTTKTEQGRLLVSTVRSDGPAYGAGVYAGDELLAIDGWRVDQDGLAARLAERVPGSTVVLSLFRRDQLLHVPVMLEAGPPNKATLRRLATPTPAQDAAYRHWLGLVAR